MRLPTIYLAGAIRDNRPEDIDWRETVIALLRDRATILNPVGGKTFNVDTKTWLMSGLPTTGRAIVKHDFWCVDRADIALFNFLALSEGYPNIGTLVEFGRATAAGCLIYCIIATKYTGHQNVAHFKLHPFLEENCAVVFHSVEDACRFLDHHIGTLNGQRPAFAGYTTLGAPE